MKSIKSSPKVLSKSFQEISFYLKLKTTIITSMLIAFGAEILYLGFSTTWFTSRIHLK